MSQDIWQIEEELSGKLELKPGRKEGIRDDQKKKGIILDVHAISEMSFGKSTKEREDLMIELGRSFRFFRP